MICLDAKGNELKVGDRVKCLPKFCVKTNDIKSVNPRYCHFIEGTVYMVTDVIKYGSYYRIDVVHNPTGLINGWCSDKFIKVSEVKTHFPKWW